MDSLTSISTILLIASSISTIIALFITERVKGSVKNYFDQKLESIKKDHAIEIHRFESELNALKAKENFKFTKLHEKRMEVLELSYKHLNDAFHNLNKLVAPFKQISSDTTFEKNEKMLLENFNKSQMKFARYYSDNKIYFNEELEKLIDSYNQQTIFIYADYSQNIDMKQLGVVDNNITFKAVTAYKRIPDKIIPIKKEIEKKFKEVLEQ